MQRHISLSFLLLFVGLATAVPGAPGENQHMPKQPEAQPYTYAAVDGGFEIVNGPGIYNRPLYGPHCRDLASFDERLLAIVGDTPEALILLLNWRVPGGGGCSAAKLGHFMAGLRQDQGSKWFRDFKTIKARYVPGHQDFELQDPLFSGAIRLSFVRPVEFEGLLVRVQLPESLDVGRLVFACGGATEWVGHLDYQGGKGSTKDFHPENCEHNEVLLPGQSFGIRRPFAGHEHTLQGTANVPLRLTAGDAVCFTKGPAQLLQSQGSSKPMVVGTCAANSGREVFFVLTTDDLKQNGIQLYLANPAQVFEACCRHYEELSQTVKINTPDPYLNLGLAAQILALDGSWHDPCFTHGPWSWSSPYAGWRICYGPTVLGWHGRVQSSVAEFFKDQIKSPEYPTPTWSRPGGYAGGHECRGAVPDLARNRSYFYNMGEVLVDHVLYDWEWTGDLDFMRKAFDFVADKLQWEERCLDPDGDGLYENWLNTWISDAHWYNGSGCIQASVYNWRANKLMADIARRLGRDSSVFVRRAEKIKQECDRDLWSENEGVYAEYKDALGLKRLHKAPEQASIYHPIDFRFCDDFQSYQMLRYTEYAIRNEIGTTPRGGRLVWSSNWLPILYSSLGLYPQESINLLLCYYRLGLTAKADALLKGVEASFFNGPCPGGIAHNQRPDGTHFGSTDFTDTTSLFVRTVVEGLFGVQMNVPEGVATVQPGFPRDWHQASIKASDLAYDYTWDGKVERLQIRTPKTLRYRVRLMARTGKVESAAVGGRFTPFQLEPGVGGTWVVVETQAGREADIRVRYREAPLASLDFSPIAAIGRQYHVEARSRRVLEVRDPQKVLEEVRLDGAKGAARIKGEPGWHTFFVLVASGKMRAWLPVDLELCPPLEIVKARLVVEGNRVRCVCALRNNAQSKAHVVGQLTIAGSKRNFDCDLAPLSESRSFKIEIGEPSRLSPGTNRLVASVRTDHPSSLSADVVDWRLAAECPAVAEAMTKARTVPLGGVLNQELVKLHQQSYVSPRPKTYSIMVQENGRSMWDWNARGYCIVEPHTERLRKTGGLFVTDVGVPFVIPERGPNSIFTSIWENFPHRVTIPIGAHAHKLYFLVAAATNPMQSMIENARIKVNLSGGQRRMLSLVNPHNLDDWLCDPYAQTGFVQYLGEKTHGLVLDVDLGEEAEIESCELECLSNEVLVGLLGMTLR